MVSDAGRVDGEDDDEVGEAIGGDGDVGGDGDDAEVECAPKLSQVDEGGFSAAGGRAVVMWARSGPESAAVVGDGGEDDVGGVADGVGDGAKGRC